MADISKITPPGSQTTYNLKDATAREQANWNTNNGVKNLSPFNSGSNTTDYNYVTGEGGFSAVKVNIPVGEYIFIASANITGTGNNVQMRYNYSDGTYVDVYATSGSSIVKPLIFSKPVVSFGIYCNINPITFSNVAIIPKSLYGADSTYEPYSLPNSKITPALIECVDSGAKNCALANTLNNSYGGVPCTQDANDPNIITLNGTNTSGVTMYIWGDNVSPVNKHITEPYVIAPAISSTGVNFMVNYTLNGEPVTQNIGANNVVPANSTINYIYVQQTSANKSINFSVKLMVLPKSIYDISHDYIPYAMSNPELTNNIITVYAEQSKNIIDTDLVKLATLNPSFSRTNNVFTIDGTLAFTVATNGKITVTGSIARAVSFMLINGLDASYSGYILSGGTASISIICQTDGSPYTAYATSTSSSGVTVSAIPSDKTARVVLSVPSGTYSNVELSPMLCSSTSWDMLSHTYQPYALSNAELTAKERANENNISANQTAIAKCSVYTATATADSETSRASFASLITYASVAAGVATDTLFTYEISAYAATGNGAFYGYGKYKYNVLHTLTMITNDTITKFAVNNTGTVVLGDCTGEITVKVRIFA